jgi:membrane fusion protein, copper/silver efflux system
MTKFLHNALSVSRVALARLRFLAVFVIVGLVVGYWEDIRNHIDKWTRPQIPPDALVHASDTEYYCAMHPQVVRDAPGDCPICGMPLIKRKKGEQMQLPADVLSRVQLSPQRVAMANVGTSLVEYRKLSRDIHAIGVFDYDETRLAQLSARVAGRADRLYLQYVGQPVRKGQTVYSLYSPEVYTALRDYLQARQRVNEMTKATTRPADELKMDAGEVYNASMQRLLLWGITRQQLDDLDAEFDKTGTIPTHLDVTSPIDGVVVQKNILEGGYLSVGSVPFTIADLSTLWLKVKLFETDIPLVHLGQEAIVNVESLPSTQLQGKVTYLDFQLDPQTRTVSARIEVKNPTLELRPGMFADAEFSIMLTEQMLTPRQENVAPVTTKAVQADYAGDYAAGLAKYLQAQKLLAGDSAQNVSALLHQTSAALQPLKQDAQLAPLVERFTAAVHGTMGKDIEGIRESFKEISAAMIDLGKGAKLPPDAPAISVYRCPMAKADWLQENGTVSNPYYGSKMLTCGGPVEPLPRVAIVMVPGPATRPAVAAGSLLAIPRTAVIDTGRRKIVYTQSAEGVFDMKEVKIGPLAGDHYPVLSGLNVGDQVVTRGAFLIDAENRLNPTVER